MSRWAGEAFARSRALARASITRSSPRAWPRSGREARAFDIFRRHPKRRAGRGDDLDFEPRQGLLERKIASIKEHASQIGALYEVSATRASPVHGEGRVRARSDERP